MRALRRKLLRDAWRLRGQVLTIAAVIACGIAAFIGALSAHDSLLQLRDAAQALGFQARGVRCDDDETLETLTLSAILHWLSTSIN